MDPQAAWDGMLTACAERDIDSAQEIAAALGQWLLNDGFSPTVLGTSGIPAGLERALAIAGVNFILEMPSASPVHVDAAEEDEP